MVLLDVPKDGTSCLVFRQSGRPFVYPLVETPVEKLLTGPTKIRTFKIRIFNAAGRVHDAPPVLAVGEAEGVSQFMDDRFLQAR